MQDQAIWSSVLKPEDDESQLEVSTSAEAVFVQRQDSNGANGLPLCFPMDENASNPEPFELGKMAVASYDSW